MTKQIFSRQEEQGINTEDVQPKREFNCAEISVESDTAMEDALQGESLNTEFERIVKPQPRWWKKLLGAAGGLFLGATVAQSVQWLVNTWVANQWIYFAFALVGLVVVLLGLTAIISEWRRLVKLKKRIILQQQSERILRQSAVGFQPDLSTQDGEQAERLCLDIARMMQIETQNPALNMWQKQINEAHSAHEVTYLFSKNVLQSFDKQAKNLISKNAAEAAVIVAISPLALVDMFFIAWRNIRLLNDIARVYGIELGYISRLRLLRMVLLNVAFAGASELVHEIGMDWLSQDLTAKLSVRAAQGIGVGLLTARLGIKAMQFCRPLSFQTDERPRLTNIHKELLTTLKSTLFSGDKIKQTEKL